MSRPTRPPTVRLRPRQWLGAAIDVTGLFLIAQQVSGWLAF